MNKTQYENEGKTRLSYLNFIATFCWNFEKQENKVFIVGKKYLLKFLSM